MNKISQQFNRAVSCRNHLLPIFSALLLMLPAAVQNAAAADAVTFNSQIAPIIYQNCSPCHRPGEAAPFSLLSYEDVKRKGKDHRQGDSRALHAAVESRTGVLCVSR